MKIFKDKRFLFLCTGLFLSIVTTTIFAYLISPIRNNNPKYLPLVLVGSVLFSLVTFFLTYILTKKYFSKYKVTFLLVLLILVNAIALTVVFKVIDVIKPDSIFHKTGFISVVYLFCYYGIILALSFLPIFVAKKDKVLTNKDI